MYGHDPGLHIENEWAIIFAVNVMDMLGVIIFNFFFEIVVILYSVTFTGFPRY